MEQKLCPSERLLRDVLAGSLSDDDATVSDVAVEWTDIEGRRWRREAGQDAPVQIAVK